MKRTSMNVRRILTVFMVVVLTISTLAIVSPVEAASNTPITDSIINARINELNSKLEGTYFNTTHSSSACGEKESEHGCSKCSNTNVIKQTWFKNTFNFNNSLSTSQFPCTYTITSYVTPSGQSCAGFASFAEWYIFRTSDDASVSTEKIGSYKSTKSY